MAAALQSVTRNLLADPHLLGISSGGAFGAILALMHKGMFLGTFTVPLMAFLGALVAALLVLAVAQWSQLIYPLVVLLTCGAYFGKIRRAQRDDSRQ